MVQVNQQIEKKVKQKRPAACGFPVLHLCQLRRPGQPRSQAEWSPLGSPRGTRRDPPYLAWHLNSMVEDPELRPVWGTQATTDSVVASTTTRGPIFQYSHSMMYFISTSSSCQSFRPTFYTLRDQAVSSRGDTGRSSE